MKYYDYMRGLLLAVTCIFLTSCGIGHNNKAEKDKIKLINDINSAYHSVNSLKVKSMVFWYESSKIPEITDNIKFVVKWERGKKLAVRAENIRQQKKTPPQSELNINKIRADIASEVGDLFQMIFPAFESVIRYGRGSDISVKESADRLILEINEKNIFGKPGNIKKIMYFNKDFMLLKMETYDNGKLTVVARADFSSYDGKYILRGIERKVLMAKGVKTQAGVQYAESKNFYLPSLLTMRQIKDGRITGEFELSVISLEADK